jgi:putative FmdB family regulatory protein
MPTYEYICRACGHEFEEFQSIKADPVSVCPKCRKKKVDRKIGIGGAVIFKGGGFYQTDYRSDSYRSAEEAEKKAGEPRSDSKPEPSGDAKSGAKPGEKAAPTADAKTEAKPEPKPDAAAAAAENKRIESRATHQSRIGRGSGNVVGGGVKKPAKSKKSSRKK